ncbi:2Fe-2S iron-sulfur cluster binding domain-containing protein [uncultured Neptuniibacter sp.]|uniref:2Fe-2S iron-sulfur cluster-binding protein n=1 Tax=uncultured Neptuniibacter sp. TaxID=502143 RepID=UPI0034532682
MDAILESGVELAHSCRSGACKSCSVRVLQGEPDHRDHCLSSADKEEKGMFCPCVSRSRNDFLKLDI